MITSRNLARIFKLLPSPSLVVLPDSPKFTIVEVNDAYLDVVQISRENLMGKGFFEAFSTNPLHGLTDWQNAFQKAIDEKLPNRISRQKYELPIPGSSNRQIKYFNILITPVLNEDDEVELIIRSVTEDTEMITIQENEKLALANLIKNEKFLSETQRIARSGSWEVDLIYNTHTWSDVLKEIHEVDINCQPGVEEGINFYKEGESRDTIYRVFNEAIKTGGLFDVELQIITAKGNERWIRTTGKAELKDGKCTRIYGATQDITGRKITERQLTESRNQFQSLVQTVDGIVWEANAQTFEFTFVSDKVKSILGFSPAEWLGEPDFWRNHIHPYDSEKATTYCHYQTQEGRNHTFDYRMIKADGNIIWIKNIVSVISEDGKPAWLRGLMVDITEIKRAEDALRRSNERHEYVNKATNDAIYDWDMTSDHIAWGDGFYRLFGFEMSNEKYPIEKWTLRIHPADQSKTERGLILKIRDTTESNWRSEYQFQKSDGSYAFVEQNGYIIRDKNGKAIRMIGVLRDVTRQKKEEHRLKLLESVITHTNDSVLIAEVNPLVETGLIILYVNEAFTKTTGYSSEELTGKTPLVLKGRQSGVADFDQIIAAIKNRKPVEIETANYKRNGEEFWINLSLHPVANGKGVFTHWIFIGHDVTERKKSQLNLLHKSQLLAAITEVNNSLLQYDDWFSAINKCFSLVGEAAAVDTVFYFENNQDESGREFASERLKWIAKNVALEINDPDLQNIPLGMLKEPIKTLNNNDPFFAIVSQLPEGDFKALLISKRIKSLLAFPIFVKNKLFGFIGINDCRKERQWSEDEISFLKTIAVNLARAIEIHDADTALLAAYAEKNTTLESIQDGFFSVSRDWTVTYWNKEAERQLGVKREEIVGRNLWDVYKESISLKFYSEYHRALEENIPVRFEEFFPPLDKWFEVSVYPAEIGLTVYFKNITERKLAETKLKELHQELEKNLKGLALSNAELEQFAYVASHDLQEPLRMITGFLSQIEKKYSETLDERGKKYIYFAVDGAKRMRQIILDLLDFSKIGRTQNHLERVDLNELIREILTFFRELINDTQAKVEFHNLPTLLTFRTPMRQIFQNLISNGLKYQEKDQTPEIYISAEETETHWQFSVKDNGIGMDSEYFNKIFIIFQRLHSKDEYSGTGMGLAVTKKIVENFGGEIWVESEEGRGSIFYFTIGKQQTTGE